ncbi:MAG TPA: hypothetical protein VMB50_03685 [Myxococcales bacterium]|nr:hypothetical protein [Myxococcales bacterium]
MPMDKQHIPFCLRCQVATGLTQKELAKLLGIGLRTVQRWSVGQAGGPFLQSHFETLARASFAKDPELAEECARMSGKSLMDMGLVPRPAPPPPPPKPPPPPPPPPKRVLTMAQADAVVCAAADVRDVPPKEVRAMVAAAFARAHELGYTVEEIAKALTPHLPAPASSEAAPAASRAS